MVDALGAGPWLHIPAQGKAHHTGPCSVTLPVPFNSILKASCKATNYAPHVSLPTTAGQILKLPEARCGRKHSGLVFVIPAAPSSVPGSPDCYKETHRKADLGYRRPR
jgi:hypothetical protein